MGRVKSWEVTDEFWKRVEPLVPVRARSKWSHRIDPLLMLVYFAVLYVAGLMALEYFLAIAALIFLYYAFKKSRWIWQNKMKPNNGSS